MLTGHWLWLLVLLTLWTFSSPHSGSAVVAAHDASAGQPAALASSQAVWPSGWRRTTRGWERTDDWLLSGERHREATHADVIQPQSINDWIQLGRARELPWARTVTQWARGIHPIAYGMMLVGAALVITRFSQRHDRGPRSIATAPRTE